ncbi:STY4526/YPO1902 family pathogenicity island replication protein [Haliea sp.]|jgi:hypothetical protein|uniref:STY4526/YPO1902 family pathogenicity island replication protein n=1 Tax=Haliea sp. TaxID=1932666 RepID=UPI000C3D037D|nr:STY4526/YPO1902 family pathogenicity island replication protein [Haliea sp.]MAD65684.1 hypothetical protein [Haliea sp.]|tara:strand:+ start:17987 stop:18973 length:987 start_codon:yes stop_codon:yes gene_type:complete
MREIYDNEAALRYVPLLLRDFIRDTMLDKSVTLESVLNLSENDAEVLRQATPHCLTSICDVAAQKGAISINIDGEALENIDVDKPPKPYLSPFRNLAINCFDITASYLYTYQYLENKGGMLGESWFSFDKKAVEVISDFNNRQVDKLALAAFQQKAISVRIDNFLVSKSIAQHLSYKKNQSRIDHLVLSKAPLPMIQFFYPAETDRDITNRRKRLGIATNKGRPARPSIDVELAIYGLLCKYKGQSQYQQVVRIADELDLDYEELWTVIGKHFVMDEGDKMELFEKRKYRMALSQLSDDSRRFEIIAGLLGCSIPDAQESYSRLDAYC